ncbi:Aspartate--tRNA ligase [Bienertia sinuspersici]
MWDDLQARYSIGNGPRIHESNSQIVDCRQHGRSVATYFGELRKLPDELSSYQKFPTCTCTATTEFVRLQESELLYHLYIGLDSKKSGSAVSTLLMQDPAPSLNVAYSRIITDERKKLVFQEHSVDRSTTVGFAVQASTNQAQSSRPPHSEYTRLKCNYCARFGHDREHCYDLHGYPAGSRGRGSTRGSHRFRGGCGGSNGRSFTSNTSRVVLQQLRKLSLKIGLMLQVLVMSNGLSLWVL